MMNFIKKYSIFIFIVVLSFFTIQPLISPGFYSMHDDEQVGRLYELDQSLKAGHFPVRISQNLGFGYGYPFFNFYPSLVYYIAEIFVLLGFGYITATKLMIGLGFIFAALAMYFFAKEYLGKWGALIAAVAYTYAPYHAVDVYVRGAIPEFWSFFFIPAIFLAFKKLRDTQNKQYIFVAALLLAGLIFTHNLVAMMSGVFIASYLVYLLLSAKKKKQFTLYVMASGFLGLLLAASFWIPSFFERGYTLIEILTKELADYKQHFVYIRQLWDSPWGYGGSLYGLYDGLSFEIGKVHIVGSVITSLIALFLLRKKNPKWKVLMVFSGLFIFAAFMTTFRSEFVWNNLSFFSYIQFPWRFLLFTAFTSSFLLGGVVLLFKSERRQCIVAILLIIISIFLYKDYFKPAKLFTNVSDRDYINLDVIRWKTSNMAFEYVPKGIATKTSNANTTLIDINKNEIAKSSFSIQRGSITVKEEIIKPHYKKFRVSGSGTLRINTYAIPGWKVFIDQKEVTFTDNNKFKLIEVSIANGNHIVEAKFTNTLYATLGNTLSLTGVLILLAGIITSLSSRPKR